MSGQWAYTNLHLHEIHESQHLVMITRSGFNAAADRWALPICGLSRSMALICRWLQLTADLSSWQDYALMAISFLTSSPWEAVRGQWARSCHVCGSPLPDIRVQPWILMRLVLSVKGHFYWQRSCACSGLQVNSQTSGRERGGANVILAATEFDYSDIFSICSEVDSNC